MAVSADNRNMKTNEIIRERSTIGADGQTVQFRTAEGTTFVAFQPANGWTLTAVFPKWENVGSFATLEDVRAAIEGAK